MPTIALSDDAVALLRRRLEGEPADVTDDTREAYRELARAGIMIPLHSFTRGDEALYRFTEEGWERRFEFTSTSWKDKCIALAYSCESDAEQAREVRGNIGADSPSRLPEGYTRVVTIIDHLTAQINGLLGKRSKPAPVLLLLDAPPSGSPDRTRARPLVLRSFSRLRSRPAKIARAPTNGPRASRSRWRCAAGLCYDGACTADPRRLALRVSMTYRPVANCSTQERTARTRGLGRREKEAQRARRAATGEGEDGRREEGRASDDREAGRRP